MTLPIIVREGRRAFPPRISVHTRPFWEALDEGRFLLGSCPACSRLSFPPSSFCPGCGGRAPEWREASGQGTLYSLTTVHTGPPQLMADGPYAGAIVDLAEGVRLVTEWIGDRGAELDSPIELVVTRYADGCLFAARLAGG